MGYTAVVRSDRISFEGGEADACSAIEKFAVIIGNVDGAGLEAL